MRGRTCAVPARRCGRQPVAVRAGAPLCVRDAGYRVCLRAWRVRSPARRSVRGVGGCKWCAHAADWARIRRAVDLAEERTNGEDCVMTLLAVLPRTLYLSSPRKRGPITTAPRETAEYGSPLSRGRQM